MNCWFERHKKRKKVLDVKKRERKRKGRGKIKTEASNEGEKLMISEIEK